MAIVLTGISLLAAVALGAVYSVTEKPIEEAQKAKAQDAIEAVMPGFARLDEPELVEVENVGELAVHRAYDSEGNFIGAAVETISKSGFNGEIRLMVGFDKSGAITNYSVLDQKETPGLGTKMTDWFKPQGAASRSLVETIFGFEVKSEARNSSVIGLNPATDNLTVAKDGGEIDGITAATISSRAFLGAIANAYAAYANNTDYKPDATSGATGTSE